MNQDRSTSQTVRGVRHLIWWAVGGLMLTASLFAGPHAWAQNVLCAGNSSIPITPLVIYIVQGVSATYDVSLCTTPTAPVTITPVLSPTGQIDVTPTLLTFTTSVTQTVSVSLTPGVDLTNVFTVTIQHNAASADPNYNWNTLHNPVVLVIYDGPLAVNDAAGTQVGVPVTISVLLNDLDRSGTGLQVVSVTQPPQGSAQINIDNTITYTPTTVFTGTETLTYTVRDGRGNQDDAQVFVAVTPSNSNLGTPETAPVDPTLGGTVIFTGTNGIVEVELPAGFITNTLGPRDIFYLIYTRIYTPTANTESPPPGLTFANFEFDLSAYLNDVKLENLVFTQPITFTITYSPALLNDVSPASLELWYWDGAAWSTDGIVIVSQDLFANTITFTVAHLTQFAFFGTVPTALDPNEEPGFFARIYLPLLLR